MNEEFCSRMREYLNTAEGFNRLNKLEFMEVRPGYCECRVALTKWSLNPQGVAHGSLVFALCDGATGVAAAATGRNMLTLCAGIHFLRPGTGEELRCVAELVKDGRTTALADAKVYDDRGRLVATGEFTVYYTGGEIELPATGAAWGI